MLRRFLNRLRSEPERVVYAAASVALAAAGARRSKGSEVLSKPLLMLSVQRGLLRTRDQRSAADNALLAVATTASLAGDWLMMEEEFARTERESEQWIVRGATAFAVNHLAMIALELKSGARPRVKDLLLRAGGLSEGLVLLATARPQLLKPLGAYSAVLALSSTVAASPQLRSAEELDSPLPGRAELGGISFVVSDATILHRKVFLHSEQSRAAAEAFVLASYAGAQRLLFDAVDAASRRALLRG